MQGPKPRTNGYKSLYSFKGGRDGSHPTAGLIDVNRTLFGATNGGGRACTGCGTVFSVSTTGEEHVLYAFKGGADGVHPSALIDANGKLYGTTVGAIAFPIIDFGTVFEVDLAGKEKVIHRFQGGTDGADPSALIDVNGSFYGTTLYGGGSGCSSSDPPGVVGCGTVFKVSRSGKERVLYSFTGGADGANPSASLIEVNGVLYGTAANGGTSGCGTVFSVSMTGEEHVLHTFTAGISDGEEPVAGLVSVNGTLYGTTEYAGSGSSGTVFSVSTTGEERLLYSFQYGNDGAWPQSGLIDVDGTLYGTTGYGGNTGCTDRLGCGIVFSVSPAGSERVLYTFNGGTDGGNPYAALTDVNGTLYGTTRYGGSSGHGTVFKLPL
jgi:uncharacterized repeat protein (TIGR03803 family)